MQVTAAYLERILCYGEIHSDPTILQLRLHPANPMTLSLFPQTDLTIRSFSEKMIMYSDSLQAWASFGSPEAEEVLFNISMADFLLIMSAVVRCTEEAPDWRESIPEALLGKDYGHETTEATGLLGLKFLEELGIKIEE